MSLKISLVTVSYNASKTIQRCIKSVTNQTYNNVEYIIIDGNSSDGTQQIINAQDKGPDVFKSEADTGIYDAMNKGIKMATGDVIGMLNADDYFADIHVLADVAQAFTKEGQDLLYADLDYVNEDGQIVRRWRSGPYRHSKFNWGWMPPHPTFYAKKELYDNWGLYDAKYGTAADYELMLRFMYLRKAKVSYLDKVIVKMVAGGASNQSYRARIKAWISDFKAMNSSKLPVPLLGIILKPLRKIPQFVVR